MCGRCEMKYHIECRLTPTCTNCGTDWPLFGLDGWRAPQKRLDFEDALSPPRGPQLTPPVPVSLPGDLFKPLPASPTVEGDGRYPLATRTQRFRAAIVDGFFYIIICFIFGVAEGASEESPEIGALLILFGLGIGAIFLTIQLTLLFLSGQSIGKKVVGIRIMQMDGNPATSAQLFLLRGALMWLLNIIPFVYLIDVLFIFQDSRRCMHDLIAGTKVVQV